MAIRFLADFNGAPLVGAVWAGANTVTARGRVQWILNEGRGLMHSPQRGHLRGHTRGLSHGTDIG